MITVKPLNFVCLSPSPTVQHLLDGRHPSRPSRNNVIMGMKAVEEWKEEKVSSASLSGDCPEKASIPLSAYNVDSIEINSDIFDFGEEAAYFKSTRLIEDRAYAKASVFSTENRGNFPIIEDLASPSSGSLGTEYTSIPLRAVIFLTAYTIFPPFITFLDSLINMSITDLQDITSRFIPGISILYGTFIALTLNKLYERINYIQDVASEECALLSLLARNIINIFEDDDELIIKGCQKIADQVRILVKESRGKELLNVMYNDPYAHILEMLSATEKSGTKESILDKSMDVIIKLTELRSQRLSAESSTLPPVHFSALSILTFLTILGYSLNLLPSFEVDGAQWESRALFAVSFSLYVLFYNFASDLNSPFSGIYQIRRSGIAAHLLQIKWLLENNEKVKGKISFERRGAKSFDTPGVGKVTLQE